MLRIEDVHCVLLRPRGAQNLGAVARLMKNFGLHNLTPVDPRLGPWAAAWMMAVHAHDVLRRTQRVPRLQDALADARWVVGTSMRPLPGQRVLTPRELAREAKSRGAPTLLFGDEESGLHNAELLRCHDVSMIPASPAQPSLNLAQAVLVYAWEFSMALLDEEAEASSAHTLAAATPRPPTVRPSVATLAEERSYQHIEGALRRLLDTSRFVDVDRPGHGVAEMMQTLRRASLTDVEARLWLVALKRSLPPTPR